jgi:hypothetical protein
MVSEFQAVDNANAVANSSRYQTQERKLRGSCSSWKENNKTSKVGNKKISGDMGIDGNGILGCWW